MTAIQKAIDLINEINDNDITEFSYYYEDIITKLNKYQKEEEQKEELWENIFEYIKSEIHEDIPHRVRYYLMNKYKNPIKK